MKQFIRLTILLFLVGHFEVAKSQAVPEKDPFPIKNWDPGKFGAYYTRLPFEDSHSGEFADIVVRVAEPEGEIIFSRETSFLPQWKTALGSRPFPEVVERTGNGPGLRADTHNKYAYARVIENSQDEVVVHWRYMKDFGNVEPDGVVHEYFYIKPSGRIRRVVRLGTAKLDDWIDPLNRIIQELELSQDGVKELSIVEARQQKLPGKPVKGNPLFSEHHAFAASWKFDEGLDQRSYHAKYFTKETTSGVPCRIDGHTALWKQGVSGTALAFDGYNTRVTLPASKAPTFSTMMTIDAYVALGAYPFNEAAIIQQFNGKDAGYFLGVNAHGNLVFKVAIQHEIYATTTDSKVPLYQWSHITLTVNTEEKVVRLFIDGRLVSTLAVPEGFITLSNTDLVIGANSHKTVATDLVRKNNNIPQLFGIEGLIDEVRLFNEPIEPEDLIDFYTPPVPLDELMQNPDLQPRILPGSPGISSEFGAYYTRLPYHDLWDNMWRTCDKPDITVKFDKMPTSIVFWRGTSSAPTWITENNIWMGDQSAEVGGPYGCAEHMADKQQRHTYVRIIENTPARVMIHWRYSCADIAYIFDSPNNWTDEYLTIYPDGTSIRKVNFYGVERPTWYEPQLFCQAGSGPLDVIEMQAVTVANMKGEINELDWSDGPPVNKQEQSCIELYNLKSDYRIFSIFPEDNEFISHGWFNTEQSAHTPDPFAGPWNHFPVSQLLSDGRMVTGYDRMTSCALGEGDYDAIVKSNIGLYGFTNQSVESLLPLAKSWNRPPEIEVAEGTVNPNYNKEERAYQMDVRSDKIEFNLLGSEDNPIINPAFVLKNYGKTPVEVKVDGRIAEENVRTGYVATASGLDLVIWLELEEYKPLQFSITPKD